VCAVCAAAISLCRSRESNELDRDATVLFDKVDDGTGIRFFTQEEPAG
jgi:hypothetical protein